MPSLGHCVILDAYLSRNLGDDLMVRSLIESKPKTRFYASNKTSTSGPSLDALGNLSYLSTLRCLLLLILGRGSFAIVGGSMFMDRHSAPLITRLRMGRKFGRRILCGGLSRLWGRKFIIVGVNVGPCETLIGKLSFPLIFRLASHVSVRDSASARLLQKWRVRAPLVAPDLVFSLYGPSDTQRNKIGISVMKWPAQNLLAVAAWYSDLVKVIRSRDESAEIVLLAFQTLGADDGKLADLILRSAVDTQPLRAIEYDGDIEAFMDEFTSCRLIIGTRFHSLVLAIAQQKPIAALCYSSKTAHALTDLGWRGNLLWTDQLADDYLTSLVDRTQAAATILDDAKVLRPNVERSALHIREAWI